MSENWTVERLQRYIDDEVQEDLNLDYKGADSLGKSDGKKREIHKDVSAMANSAGGVLIYGIREFDDDDKRHLPERFDPVDQSTFTREWLEQVISGIQPRVQGVVITPVPLGPNATDVAFVVDVPASNTAHQAGDFRYYKRYNFESVPMNAYEIRDVMNRSSQAIMELDLELELEHRTVERLGRKWRNRNPDLGQFGLPSFAHDLVEERGVVETTHHDFASLNIEAKNIGSVFARHVVAYFYLPLDLFDEASDADRRLEDGRGKIRVDNNQNASSGTRHWQTPGRPILPGTTDHLGSISLSWAFVKNDRTEAEIYWEVFCDSAQVRSGKVNLSDLRVTAHEHRTRHQYDPMDVLSR